MSYRAFYAAALMVATAALSGCGGNSGTISLIPTAATPTARVTTVAVEPASATVVQGATAQFQVPGQSSQAINWSVQEAGGGQIDSNGLYVAPGTAGTFHVVAALKTDSSVRATATVTVLPAVSVSPATSGFRATASMSTPRAGHTATLLPDGKVLVVGGADGRAELFDPATDTFSSTGTPVNARLRHTATLLANGKVLIVGGGATSGGLLASAELYDPQTGTFTAAGSMLQARAAHTATLLPDGTVLIAGGGGFGALASAEIYDAATGTFTPTGSMATDREEHTATLLPNGKVLIVGGWNGHGADALDDPPWDPMFGELFATGSFTQSGSMSTTRIAHTATRLLNGTVLLFGGVPHLQNIHDQPPAPAVAEIFDPATGKFSALTTGELSRIDHTATLLPSGSVLIVGGSRAWDGVSTPPPLGSAGLLDPLTGAFTLTGDLVTPREGHTATMLNDGRMLVIGGKAAGGGTLRSAEIYR